MSTDLPADRALAIEPPAGPSPRQTIVGPMPCVKCLYDLNGLGEDQKCPECGTEALRTLGSPAAAAAADLVRLRRGLMMIAIAMIGGTTWIVLGQFFVLLLAFGIMGGVSSSVPMLVVMSIVPAFSIVLAILSAFGWSRITTSIASMHADRARTAGAVRRLAWAFAVLYVASASALIALQVIGSDGPESSVTSTGIVIMTFAIWTARTALGAGLLAGIARAFGAMKTVHALQVLIWAAIALPTIIATTAISAGLLELDGMPGLYLEYIIGGTTLLLAIVIVALGVTSLVMRSMLGPFARAASLRRVAAA